MPVITIEMWDGRTLEQKRKIVKGITSVMGEIGIPAEAVQIIIKDVPKHNWGIAGKLASDE